MTSGCIRINDEDFWIMKSSKKINKYYEGTVSCSTTGVPKMFATVPGSIVGLSV
jgi:hypothetical protein